jgi:hypothetical protein
LWSMELDVDDDGIRSYLYPASCLQNTDVRTSFSWSVCIRFVMHPILYCRDK